MTCRAGATAALCIAIGFRGSVGAGKASREPGPKKREPELVGKRPSDGPLAQMPPLQLPDDPGRPAKVALGHALFFDKRLSALGDHACASCHAFDLWNVGYYVAALYHDGRAATLEAAAQEEWGGASMGVGAEKLDAKAAELAAIPGYKKLFVAAFGSAFGATTQIKASQVAAALGEYMRTLVCTDTAYDRFARGESAALTDAQKRGLDVFAGKGGCITCHTTPYFTTAMGVASGAYFNTGIGTSDAGDVGRMNVTGAETDRAAFKPPSLRNITRSAPYFHDGSAASLDAAVRLMASGGIKNQNKNPALVDRQLSDAELADLVAFLGALDCAGTLDAPALP